MDKTCLALTTD